MKHYPRLVIAGTSSGVGKTTATLAILAALRERGRGSSRSRSGPTLSTRVITGLPQAARLEISTGGCWGGA